MENLKKFIRSLLIRLKRLVGIEAAEIIVRRFVLRLKLWFRCLVWYRLYEISGGSVNGADMAMYALFGHHMMNYHKRFFIPRMINIRSSTRREDRS